MARARGEPGHPRCETTFHTDSDVHGLHRRLAGPMDRRSASMMPVGGGAARPRASMGCRHDRRRRELGIGDRGRADLVRSVWKGGREAEQDPGAVAGRGRGAQPSSYREDEHESTRGTIRTGPRPWIAGARSGPMRWGIQPITYGLTWDESLAAARRGRRARLRLSLGPRPPLVHRRRPAPAILRGLGPRSPPGPRSRERVRHRPARRREPVPPPEPRREDRRDRRPHQRRSARARAGRRQPRGRDGGARHGPGRVGRGAARPPRRGADDRPRHPRGRSCHALVAALRGRRRAPGPDSRSRRASRSPSARAASARACASSRATPTSGSSGSGSTRSTSSVTRAASSTGTSPMSDESRRRSSGTSAGGCSCAATRTPLAATSRPRSASTAGARR